MLQEATFLMSQNLYFLIPKWLWVRVQLQSLKCLNVTKGEVSSVTKIERFNEVNVLMSQKVRFLVS